MWKLYNIQNSDINCFIGTEPHPFVHILCTSAFATMRVE